MCNIDLDNIIARLNLTKADELTEEQVFEKIYSNPAKQPYFYANLYLLKNLYLPKLEQLKFNGDITDDCYKFKIREIHAFFTWWYSSKNLGYPEPEKYAFVLSPSVHFSMSQIFLDGQTYFPSTINMNLASANLLRQSIEFLLLESCKYPLNKNGTTPQFAKIIKALKEVKINAVFEIDECCRRFIPNSFTKLDILEHFYKYLSHTLHKNMSGLLFSWQLDFIHRVMKNAFNKTIPSISIFEKQPEAEFYTNNGWTQGLTNR